MPRSTLVQQPQPSLLSLMSSASSASSFEDYLNFDMFANDSPNSAQSTDAAPSSSISASASSRASSHSPSGSTTHLPATPPQAELPPSFSVDTFTGSYDGDSSLIDESLFGTFGSYDGGDLYKTAPDPLTGLSTVPFDLFSAFNSAGFGAANPPSGNQAAAGTMAPMAINPQLVGTPAETTSPSVTSPPGGEESSAEDDQDGGDDESLFGALEMPQVKVGGKGKARKGTLHSGGVAKRSSVGPPSIFGSLAGEKPGAGKSVKDDVDLDDWRPSPEEYQKMSSKEKRQLRNKISARNFRVRRKEYIHTLEGDIAERDKLIDAIRNELGSTKSENTALRQEVAALKKAILEGRASPMLPPPAPLSPLSPLSTFPATQSPAPASNATNNIIKPNTQKDLPTSPRLGAIGSGAFWGGQAAGFGGLGGGITPVHTTIIPETTFGAANVDRSSENINPVLNQAPLPFSVAANKLFSQGTAANVSAQQQQQNNVAMSQILSQLGHGGLGAFDTFSDVNPFTLKTLDAYRMQLWSSVARQAQQQRMRAGQPTLSSNGYPSPSSSNTSPSSSPTHSPNLSGLANGLRPAYFTSKDSTLASPTSSKTPFSGLLSGKGLLPYHSLPTPPASPKVGEKERAQQSQQRAQTQQAQQQAMLASLASQTLLQKMGQAFWDAFSGSSSSSSAQGHSTSGNMKSWDADKVRRVLEGKAVLRVVDVEKPMSSGGADALEESMRSLSLSSSSTVGKDDKKEKKPFLSRLSCGSPKQ